MTMMTTSGSIRRLYTILYIFLIFLTVSCKSCGSPQSDDDEKQQQQSSSIPSKDIQLHLELFQACQKGPASKVKEILTHHPDWIPSRIASGETCLHTASITGQVDVIELLVGNFKMNPNVQTKGHGALRDTPLSMNVKNGNVQAAKVLLENGADVHLDFDSMLGGRHAVTVLDILSELLPANFHENPRPDLQKYVEMRELLLDYGAKRWNDIQGSDEL